MPISDEQLNLWRAVCRAAAPGPWTPGYNPSTREPMEYIREAYEAGTPGTIHLVCVPVEGKPLGEEALFTAITGNGPTSEANATHIAWAHPGNVLALLDEVTKLRELVQVMSEYRDQAVRERDAMRAVVEAAGPMRDHHEGCVVEPPCGNCSRCVFDAAVDAFRLATGASKEGEP